VPAVKSNPKDTGADFDPKQLAARFLARLRTMKKKDVEAFLKRVGAMTEDGKVGSAYCP
jgi:hypothetical protein